MARLAGDLPGYGYARESKAKIAAWNELLNAYLRGVPIYGAFSCWLMRATG